MRALLVANSDDADAGFTGERFRFHGFAFLENHRERPAEWVGLDGIDLVVLLGSEWSVYWDHVATEVSAELALIRAAHGRGVPVYGICFGAQSITAALGGSVAPATEDEIGWYDNVASDVDAIAAGPWMHWHSDAVSLAPGAVELARSPVCPQAFRLGRTFATQFHPEVTEAMITRWATSGAATLARRGTSVEELRADTSRHVLTSRPNAERLVDWYLESVASGPG